MVNRTSRYRWMLDLPSLLQILYRENPDIVEAGDPYHAAMLSRNWANRRGADFYMFYHSHFPDALLRTVLKFAGTWARKWVERVAGDYLRNLADKGKGVFVGSHHLIRVLDGWGVKRLIHLPLGFDTSVYRPDATRDRLEIRKKLGLPPDLPVLLYVGRFSPDKDTGLLLRCWLKIGHLYPQPWMGVMIGDGQMTESVEKFCRQYPKVRRIPFLHDPRELADWYRAADLLIHPGRWETFGLVLLEAQGCGLPTVAFRGGPWMNRQPTYPVGRCIEAAMVWRRPWYARSNPWRKRIARERRTSSVKITAGRKLSPGRCRCMGTVADSFPNFRVRPYRSADRPMVRKICGDTGFLGQPIDPIFQDRELFNDFLTSPYTDAEPECCFVLEGQGGAIQGYLTASKDTAKHGNFLRAQFPSWLRRAARGFFFSYNLPSRKYLLWLIFRGWRETPETPRGRPLSCEFTASGAQGGGGANID